MKGIQDVVCATHYWHDFLISHRQPAREYTNEQLENELILHSTALFAPNADKITRNFFSGLVEIGKQL